MSSATAPPGTAASTRYVGESVPRREDFRFLTGTGKFCEDITLTRMLYASLVRSTLAHADIVSINTDAARAQPGVVAVFTAADFGDDEMGTIPTDWTLPIMDGIPDRYPLARDVVKYVGEAVAVVIAETRVQADDAGYFVDVEYAERPAVIGTEAAAGEGSPLVHDRYERNTSYLWHLGTGDWDAVAATADHVVDLRLVNQRVHASSLEARVSLADYQVGSGTLTLYLGTQNVHVVRRNLSIAIGIPENRIRVVTPAVGGAFGSKLCLYPEDVIVSVASRRLRRPVRWAESRAEHFTGTSGGRDHVEYVSLAADDQGKIQALKVTTYANLGAYVSGMGAGIPVVSGMVFPGVYDIAVADVDIHGVFTNTSTTETYRGAGRPEAAYLIERAVDELAAKTGIDRVELRRRNFIQPHQFPYSNATGMTYDSGDYEKALDKALAMAGWDALLAEQTVARSEGKIVGLGLSVYTEFCGFGDAFQLQLVGFDRATWEQSVITVTRTGSVIVQVGIDAAGQGHETSIAQIVATELGLDIDEVEVLQGDTDIVHFGTGTFNSRSMSSAGTSAALAARKIMAKATRLAAHLLDAAVDDIVYMDGVFSVGPDDGGRQLSFEDVAVEAWRGVDLPEGMEPTLKEMAVFDPPAFTSPFGVHIAAVEIDPDTGAITIDRYIAVDDCGNLINPALVNGQIHGGVAQGIGQALYEDLSWDEDGQPMSASFMQYAVPRAHQLPQMETGHTITPSPVNPLGVKGVGESGAIGSQPAVVNAVMDAVRGLGVANLDMPLTPAKVWTALQEAAEMIPSTFAYSAPETLHDALSILAANEDDTKVMAGGQSLIPLLKLRLAGPAVVMDISRLDELREIDHVRSGFRIGALVTHERLINDTTITGSWPIIADAGEDLADPLVRNLGTFGGSLAHADPAGDWPAVALATDVIVHVRSLRGTREIAVKDFFTYLFTADIADDEILTHVELAEPAPGTVTAYVKIAHPASGYAVAAAGVRLTIDAGGTCRAARVALTGVATTPLRSVGAERALEGSVVSADTVRRAVEQAADGIDVMGDTYAPVDYRRHLIGVVTGRAVQRALDRRP